MLVLEKTKIWYKYISYIIIISYYFKSIWTYDPSMLFAEDDTEYKKVFDVAKKT